jgi:transcriptional regulator with XRE-family HTH domain
MTQNNGDNTPAQNDSKGNDFPSISGVDRYRTFVFPNQIRKYRKVRNVGSLLQLSQKISSITYIRLSKLERGEVFARAEEIKAIAAALGISPELLLADIDEPGFDIAEWAEDFLPSNGGDDGADSLAVVLAAAMRARRASDDTLTIAAIEKDYGIAPVILSRIENAYKPLDRWSPDIQKAMCRFFDVADVDALVIYLRDTHSTGALDAIIPLIANPEARAAKTRAKVQALREELAAPVPASRTRRGAKAERAAEGEVQAPPPSRLRLWRQSTPPISPLSGCFPFSARRFPMA